MRIKFKSLSAKIALGIVVLLVLQYIPITGIFLMFVAAPFLTGMLVNLLLVVLFFEAVTGRVSQLLILIPVLAYGGYLGLYMYQGTEISEREVELQTSNSPKPIYFDSKRQPLVLPDAVTFVRNYRIPVAYSKSPGSSGTPYTAHFLVTKDQCDRLDKARFPKARKYPIPINLPGMTSGQRRHLPKFCQMDIPMTPGPNAVNVIQTLPSRTLPDWAIRETEYRLEMNGRTLGEYRTATVKRYLPVPLPVLGCYLNSGTPSWTCTAELFSIPYDLNVTPKGVARFPVPNPAAIMLGIKRYSLEDLMNYRGHPGIERLLTPE